MRFAGFAQAPPLPALPVAAAQAKMNADLFAFA